MVNEETTLREVVPFMLKTINSAIPAVNDVPKLLAIIEKLKVAMEDIANKNTCWRLYEIDKYKSYEDGWEGVAEFANKTLKELDEIVGRG